MNTASGDNSTVAGGGGFAGVSLGNTASGNSSTVPGGQLNTAAGDYSFAAGRRAKANHDGAFVWADSTNADFASTAADQFLIRAAGGVGIGETNPSATLDVVGTTELNGDVTINSNLTVDTDTLFVDGTNGRVGIGTTSPGGDLHVTRFGGVNILLENTGDTTGGRNVAIRFRHANGEGAKINALREAGDDDGMNLTFSTQPIDGSLTQRMVIDPDGRVGIGTTSPTEALDVVGNIQAAGTVAADAFVGDGSGLSGLVGSTVDLDNVALLRWDLLNQSVPVGNFPRGVAFDGANIWVANLGDDNVTKLRASDGAQQPGSPFTVGGQPRGVAFDGANIWVANGFSNSVTRISLVK